MKITTIGRGSIGGTLAASGPQPVIRSPRWAATAATRPTRTSSCWPCATLTSQQRLAGVTGLDGKTVIEASNRLDGEAPHGGHASNAEYVKSVLGGPTAKAFNLNFGKLLEGAAQAPNRPDNIWVGDEAARAAVEQLTHDAGMQPRHAGPLDRANTQEAFAALFVAIVNDADAGLLYYRFAPPEAI